MAKSRALINFWVDAGAFVSFCLLSSTGLLLEFRLPPGNHGQTLWGLGRHDWGELHLWLGIALLALILVHLILHWSWVLTIVRGGGPERVGGKRRLLLAGAGLVLLIVLGIAPFFGSSAPARRPANPLVEQHD